MSSEGKGAVTTITTIILLQHYWFLFVTVSAYGKPTLIKGYFVTGFLRNVSDEHLKLYQTICYH